MKVKALKIAATRQNEFVKKQSNLVTRTQEL
jgi:hypothetical protein